MIGCFYDHGQWVALQLQSHPETGDTLVVARLGECPGDADGHDVPLARLPTAGAALDRALHRLTAGWRHAADEPPAPPARARAAIAHPVPLRVDATVDRAPRARRREPSSRTRTRPTGAGSASSATPPPAEPRPAHPAGPTHHPHTQEEPMDEDLQTRSGAATTASRPARTSGHGAYPWSDVHGR